MNPLPVGLCQNAPAVFLLDASAAALVSQGAHWPSDAIIHTILVPVTQTAQPCRAVSRDTDSPLALQGITLSLAVTFDLPCSTEDEKKMAGHCQFHKLLSVSHVGRSLLVGVKTIELCDQLHQVSLWCLPLLTFISHLKVA